MIWEISRFEDTVDNDHVVDEYSICVTAPVKLMVSRTTTNGVPGPVNVYVWGTSPANRSTTVSSIEEGRQRAVKMATVWLSETITYINDTPVTIKAKSK